MRKELEDTKRHHGSRDAQEFKEDIGALLPWHLLWAKAFLGHVSKTEIAHEIEQTRTASTKAAQINYREEFHTSDEIASLWLGILLETGYADPTSMDELTRWADSLRRPLSTPALTRITRLAARTTPIEAYALTNAAKTFSILNSARMDAEEKSGGYVDIARAILVLSQSDAATYFNEAVEVASKIGDENLARWDALLDLADRAATLARPAPKIAYKFSRCAELTYDYVVRDKHFDWYATARALAGLCPSSSLAILSRWRDRQFGWPERLLPKVVESLINRGSLDPLDALELLGFRAQWDEVWLLDAALKSCGSKAAKEGAVAFAFRYIVFDDHTAEFWRRLKSLLTANDLSLPDLDDLAAFSERQERSKQDRTNDDRPLDDSCARDTDWDAVFKNCDLALGNDISLAHQRFRDLDPPFYTERFFEQAAKRVATGKEPEFVRAVADVAGFDLYHLRNLLEAIPEAWKSRLAIKSALADMLKTYCKRFCMVITKDRHYQVLPFKLACELSGLEESPIVDAVLTAVGESAELVESDRLFSLVGLLAVKLSHDDALNVLSFGLGLFDAILEENDGDGSWSESLGPPKDIESAVAGYIWGGLASPIAAVRWEAAHAVRGICTLGRGKVLAALIAFAESGTILPFVDAHLFFYALHAREWLLIALARAAKDRPDVLARHSEFFINEALYRLPHVMIRAFAARVAGELIDRGLSRLTARCDRDW